jgi:hypothetical protein
MNIVHPEDAAARATPKSAVIAARRGPERTEFGVVMVQQDKREARRSTIANHGDRWARAKNCRRARTY